MNFQLDDQSIIDILGIQALPDERKAELVDKTTELVQKRLLVKIFDVLPEGKRDEFEQALDSEDPAKINDFLAENVPNLQDLVKEEVNSIKQQFTELASSID